MDSGNIIKSVIGVGHSLSAIQIIGFSSWCIIISLCLPNFTSFGKIDIILVWRHQSVSQLEKVLFKNFKKFYSNLVEGINLKTFLGLAMHAYLILPSSHRLHFRQVLGWDDTLCTPWSQTCHSYVPPNCMIMLIEFSHPNL